MQDSDLFTSLLPGGHDPSRLIFEDELTGIHNRRFLHHYFQHKIAWDFTDGWQLSVLMIDVDHFKHINDDFGHQAGDQTLLTVAKILKEECGASAIPIRYGGDEFVV
ncbi:MAG TPA: GGDEF domain-containing protein, partial [Nitrospirales bacterium]|nr:GGDEF domain-containing protein [Nitrospirales bacterium]